MKFNGSTIFWTLIWSLFMGVTAISIGFGALFPSMNRIAKPLICPAGEMTVEMQTYNPYPGNTITTETWYCVDSLTGAKVELGLFPMVIYSGLFYGFILFVIIYLFMWINSKRSASASPTTAYSTSDLFPARDDTNLRAAERFRDEILSSQRRSEELRGKTRATLDAVTRMKELKELRDSNMISESEYEAKRAEILKNI